MHVQFCQRHVQYCAEKLHRYDFHGRWVRGSDESFAGVHMKNKPCLRMSRHRCVDVSGHPESVRIAGRLLQSSNHHDHNGQKVLLSHELSVQPR